MKMYTVENNNVEMTFEDLKTAVGYGIVKSLEVGGIVWITENGNGKLIYMCDNGTLTAVDGIRWH